MLYTKSLTPLSGIIVPITLWAKRYTSKHYSKGKNILNQKGIYIYIYDLNPLEAGYKSSRFYS